MLKKLRDVRIVDNDFSKYNMIRRCQRSGKMGTYSVEGYIAYDTDEYENYKANVKMGRPAKMVKDIDRFTMAEFLVADNNILQGNEGLIRQIKMKCEEIID